ncbi:glycosyltransferase [Candidatus Peregrinibacteria bacterium]|nr:glycosyltransferase [Candidatus Peregrinibacteria bacterium]
MIETAVIVVPAYNEEATLVEKILELERLTRDYTQPRCDIVIADNNSNDQTARLANELAASNNRIKYNFVAEKGKGSAIRRTWLLPELEYDVYSFMDEDLSTGLDAFPYLIEAIDSGAGVAIGSRYIPGANTTRQFRREVVSRAYRTLFDFLFNLGVNDPQCGFKAISRDVRNHVLPSVETDNFFFDTELLVKANYAGYLIREVPVTWVEDAGTTVNLRRDVPKFLYGAVKLKCAQLMGRLDERISPTINRYLG